MKNYKIYVNYFESKGPENLGYYNVEDAINLLDMLVYDYRRKTIIVIECDKELDYEFPIFLYDGVHEEKYQNFRDNLIDKNAIKTLQKVRKR